MQDGGKLEDLGKPAKASMDWKPNAYTAQGLGGKLEDLGKPAKASMDWKPNAYTAQGIKPKPSGA